MEKSSNIQDRVCWFLNRIKEVSGEVEEKTRQLENATCELELLIDHYERLNKEPETLQSVQKVQQHTTPCTDQHSGNH